MRCFENEDTHSNWCEALKSTPSCNPTPNVSAQTTADLDISNTLLTVKIQEHCFVVSMVHPASLPTVAGLGSSMPVILSGKGFSDNWWMDSTSTCLQLQTPTSASSPLFASLLNMNIWVCKCCKPAPWDTSDLKKGCGGGWKCLKGKVWLGMKAKSEQKRSWCARPDLLLLDYLGLLHVSCWLGLPGARHKSSRLDRRHKTFDPDKASDILLRKRACVNKDKSDWGDCAGDTIEACALFPNTVL